MKNLKDYAKIIFINLGILLVGLIALESIFILYLKSPSLQKHFELPEFYRIFIKMNISEIIQYKKECSTFDKELFYTLKPGECNFSVADSNEKYSINSLGVRDDEESLKSPNIIVLGDSYAMGWGVKEDETFPALLENKTKLKVLNAGVSSYGTVRELTQLKRFDTSQLKYLIIQYCPNDLDENKAFLKSGNKLIISDKSIYQNLQNEQDEKNKYYLGKYLYSLFKILGSSKEFEFSRNLDNYELHHLDRSKANTVFPNGKIEAFGEVSVKERNIIFFNGWAFDKDAEKQIESFSFFVNGKEMPSMIRTKVNRKDLFPIHNNPKLKKIGWNAGILMPEDYSEEISIEAVIKDYSGNYFLLNHKDNIPIKVAKQGTQAEVFLQVVNNLLPDLKDTQIIVISTDIFNSTKSNFLEDLEKKKLNYSGPINRLKPIDVQKYLERKNFFNVDDHINSSGHEIIAEKIYESIKN